MRLSALHLLLTYRCVYECDHCFVWGGPTQAGTMTRAEVSRILSDASGLGTIEWIWFEGGEPFLYYPVLLEGLREARSRGFRTGVVTNGSWATSPVAALAWLGPLAEAGVDTLQVSDDPLHEPDVPERRAAVARRIAGEMGFDVAPLVCTVPGVAQPPWCEGGAEVMFRGRATVKLVEGVERRPWDSFDACTRENLLLPERVHIDPYGNVHVCQGLTMGSLWWSSLTDLVRGYDPASDPVIGPLLRGGPAELVRTHALPHENAYADSCHLCYEARRSLRERFPDELAPGAMYGEADPGVE